MECGGCCFPCETFYSCEICNENLCKDCHESVSFNADWLYDLDNKCNDCGKRGCIQCLSACYQCCNVGEDKVLCMNCDKGKIQDVSCEYHDWYVCDKCDKECQQCFANKNYSDKYQIL